MTEVSDDVAGFVLAGGRSSRMGEDKALVEVAGRPLVAYAVHVLRGAGLEPRIAGGRPDLNEFAPVIADLDPGLGPLGGVVSALENTRQKWAVFLSVDTPLMAPELVAFLVRDAQMTGAAITLSTVNGFAETFPAVVRTEMLPALRQELGQGNGGCFAAFAAASHHRRESTRRVPAEVLAQTGQVTDPRGLWPHQWFLNVNTGADLKRATALLEG